MKTIFALICLAAGTTVSAYTNATPGTIDRRLDSIVIPACEFRNGNAADVLEFLISSIIVVPESKDIRSISLIDTNATSRPQTEIIDRSLPACSNLPPLSLNVRRIKVREVLNYVTSTLNLHYKVTATNILIFTDDGILLNKQ
jgi:hypothetical protein